jgi:hypothetical protein
MSVVNALLISTYIRPGIYALVDYISQKYGNNITDIFVGGSMITLNIIYLMVYFFALITLISTNEKTGFVHNKKLKFILSIISIIILTIIFLIKYYSSTECTKHDFNALQPFSSDEVILQKIDKTLILIELCYIFYLSIQVASTGKNIIKGETDYSEFKISMFITGSIIILIISVIRGFRLKYLIKKQL